ncbi:uncharacterized protein LOC143845193 isoform X2 [Paroedura picta]|uniref:uncharacterized protein LOC143845193 isoform X2 n=1 Tax=Paroedura picta TaxID=143630 RepID=UPI004056EEDF
MEQRSTTGYEPQDRRPGQPTPHQDATEETPLPGAAPPQPQPAAAAKSPPPGGGPAARRSPRRQVTRRAPTGRRFKDRLKKTYLVMTGL